MLGEDAIILIDANLQDPVELIPKILQTRTLSV